MLQWTESKAVIMTADGNCILRGRDKYNFKLYLVNEPSKLKVKTFRCVKNTEDTISHKSIFIGLSDKVIEKYNLTNSRYDEKIFGKLVGVKVSCTYEIKN